MDFKYRRQIGETKFKPLKDFWPNDFNKLVSTFLLLFCFVFFDGQDLSYKIKNCKERQYSDDLEAKTDVIMSIKIKTFNSLIFNQFHCYDTTFATK